MEICNLKTYRNDFGVFQRHALEHVSEMDHFLRSRNTKFVVAIYPDQYSVDPKLAPAVARTFHKDLRDYDLTLPQKVLKRHLDSQLIPYVDLTPGFRSEGADEDLYLPRDTHWNRHGNELAAKLLFDYLTRIPWFG